VKSPDELTTALMQTMAFTPDELVLNRSGRLSSRQRTRGPYYQATTLEELLTAWIFTVPAWWIVALIRFALRREVQAVEGHVRLEIHFPSSVSVGKYRFSTNLRIAQAFEAGSYYRLYFKPADPSQHSYPRLLSGEAL
jgi:hypothetical protein